ncbi:MAG: flagellin, partial [Clostridia bacterium]|nr:flagellin [Clostridia bacterium]
MRINHNIAALNTYSRLTAANNAQSKSLEKLSSGLRINRAGDDAAGLAISEKMRGQIRGLDQAARNSQDAISLIQTAEGALTETHAILQRMRELADQAANDTNQPEDRIAIKEEVAQLETEITRIAEQTEFNGKKLLNGSFGIQIDAASTNATGSNGIVGVDVSGAKTSETYTLTGEAGKLTLEDSKGNAQVLEGLVDNFTGTLNFDKLGVSLQVANFQGATGVTFTAGTDDQIITGATAEAKFQIGANENQSMAISIADMSTAGLGIDSINGKMSNHEDATKAITTIDDAIKKVSAERSKLGANQNRLEHTINNLSTSAENLQAAESRIRDVDMAKEMM